MKVKNTVSRGGPVEMARLRNATLCNLSAVILSPTDNVPLPLPDGTGAAIDLEIEVALPASGPGFSFGVRVFASRPRRPLDHVVKTKQPTLTFMQPTLNGTNFRHLRRSRARDLL